MSKYTTEVRFICETIAGYDESQGYKNVDEIISVAAPKIFSDKYPIYDPIYRNVLNSKILKHFYTREICCETVGLWQLWLNEKMEMIMPYYNQLYKSALLEFNPLYDTDYKTEGNRDSLHTGTGTNESESSFKRTDNLHSQRTDNLTQSSNNTETTLYSDTPQGSLTGIESNTYLTNATKVTSSGTVNNTGTQGVDNTGSQSNDGNETNTETRNFKDVDEYAEHVIGKRGTQSYASIINEFRRTFLNIDLLICEELEDLFFQLW